MHRAGRAVALALAAAGACEPGARDTHEGRDTSVSGLDLTVSTDRPAYRPGEPITLALQVRNPSRHSITLEFATAQRYDFVIERLDGKEVWRWSADQMFAQLLGEQVVPSSWAADYGEQFTGSLAPGTYRLRGILTTTGDQRAAATEFVVR